MLFLMKVMPSHQCDCWLLRSDMDKEMQKAYVKALIITDCYGLSSLVKPDTIDVHCAVQLYKNVQWLVE
jgi:hypothetical protein